MDYIETYQTYNEGFFSKTLPIVKIPDPILRKKCRDIELIGGKVSEDITKLVSDMYNTMWGIGVGLAAPQIGRDINLFVINPRGVGKMAFINPKIVDRSKETTYSTEGCLSIPGRRGRVVRNKSVTVEWVDLYGSRMTDEFSGFEAIVIQHEYDHLNGILYIDKLV